MDKKSVGRPSKYKPEFVEQAKKLCKLGATDLEVADFFEINEKTLNRWKLEYPEFCQSLKMGKEESDQRVIKSLYQRATGYSHDTVKILQNNGVPLLVPYREHYPPDTTAAIFWLKNRVPAEWRDVKAVEHSGDLTHHHVDELSDEQLEDIATGRSKRTPEKKGSEKKVH